MISTTAIGNNTSLCGSVGVSCGRSGISCAAQGFSVSKFIVANLYGVYYKPAIPVGSGISKECYRTLLNFVT
jgi:hypothetical protein